MADLFHKMATSKFDASISNWSKSIPAIALNFRNTCMKCYYPIFLYINIFIVDVRNNPNYLHDMICNFQELIEQHGNLWKFCGDVQETLNKECKGMKITI